MNDYGETPLYTAIYNSYISIAELLIEKGADVNIKTESGYAPLHNAYSVELAELLLENGADANVRDDYGYTPLFMTYDVEIAKLLIEHGAKVNVSLEDGTSLLLYQMLYGTREIVDLLVKEGAVADDYPLHYAAYAGNLEEIKSLINEGYDVNEAEVLCGCAPLHFVVDVETAKLLLDNGADINIPDYYGSTPLDYVVSEEVRNFLIENGAVPGIPTGGG